MADATNQKAKADAANKAGRSTSAYEIHHDEAWARACVYGHVCGGFRNRDELVRNLNALEEPRPGTHQVFDHDTFAKAFVAERDQLLTHYRQQPGTRRSVAGG